MGRITRFGGGQPYTVDSEAAAAVLPFERIAGGSVQTAGSLTINIYGCNKEDPTGETFVQCYKNDGEAAVIAAGGAGIWPFPDEMYKYLWCKLVGTQTAVDVCMKG